MIILVDADDVLADFTGEVLRIGNELTGSSYTTADAIDWDIWSVYPKECKKPILDRVSAEGFCMNLPVLQGAKEGVELLRTHGDVFVVTSPWWSSKTWCWERIEWCHRYLDFPRHHVLNVHHKHLIRGDVLIDDKVDNIFEWTNASGGLGLLWSMPRNERSSVGVRVRSWDDVRDHLMMASLKGLRL